MDHTQHEYKAEIDPVDAGKYQNVSHVNGVTLGWGRRSTRLLHNFVLLRFPKLPEVSAGGVILEAKQFYGNEDGSVPRDATVVAVGPGKWVEKKGNRGSGVRFQPTELRVGDRVLIDAMHTQTGLLSEWDGERGDFRMVTEDVIAARLDPEVRLEVA